MGASGEARKPAADSRGQARSRRLLSRLLGGFAPTQFEIAERRPFGQPTSGVATEQLALLTPDGEKVRGFLTGPAGEWHGRPAVLYCHAHGNRYGIGADELLDGRPTLQPEPYGTALAKRGMVALSIDMPCFGARAGDAESALSKRRLWEGRTLFGQMLSELAGAFEFLAGLDGVDSRRISAFGFSMGATQAFWLGALEPRLARVAHLCAFADLATLVATGAHDLHGPYMTVPGLLGAFTTGEIAGLVAPRPQLAIMGALDPLTPPEATAAAIADLRQAYGPKAAALHIDVMPETGHLETPAARARILGFLSG